MLMNEHDLNMIVDLSGTFNTHTCNNDFQKQGVQIINTVHISFKILTLG